MSVDIRVRPFSNGSDYMYWNERNCCRCAKYRPEATRPDDGCDIEIALSIASVDDGHVEADIARRACRPGAWDCGEIEVQP